MPFTFSHPAIVLPFSKEKRISLTGLIAGSVVPDMEFLLRLKETNNFAHDWPWVLVFNVPLALLLTFLYHYIIRDPLIANSPKWFRERLTAFTNFDWKECCSTRFLQVLISIVIGIASHIFLDAMTHNKGAITRLANFFYYDVYFGKHKLPVYDILQFAGSLIGAIYILWFISRLKPVKAAQPASLFFYWLTVLGFFLLILLVRFYLYFKGQSIEDVIIAIVGAVVYSIIAASAISAAGRNKKSLRM
ncbi:MAG: DUF4184 family protein [Bacteroidetes bacterium]|nr:DUF4184 family protein [Bacteroidota bacterium]